MNAYQGKPARHPVTPHDGITYFDALHRKAMRDGSEKLRARILQTLADRQAKFSERVQLHDAARDDIRRGLCREAIIRNYGLSVTAYEQLAGQVRAGA